MGVVLASKGYPGSYEKGYAIEGLDGVTAKVYHMGTKRQEGSLVTSGGRVMMVVGRGSDIQAVRDNVYTDVAKISCPNLFCREDIAWQALR